jgi:NAD(P)-dependent dehydrogenase (short-subunit alcohol dehydrogenase family)
MSKSIALITGANKGIGFETARQLAQEGVHVIIASRDRTKGEAAAKRIADEGLGAETVALDVTDLATIESAARDIEKKYGRLDILVNNAGIMIDAFDKPPSEQAIDLWRRTFDTNLFGVVATTKAFLPLLRKSAKGRIVNVSSILGSMAANVDPQSTFYNFKIPAYNISKSALNAWTVHLAYELRETPIKVNAAHPGFVKTDLHGVDAPLSPQQGAKTSVRLALLSDDSPTGSFFHGEEVQPW